METILLSETENKKEYYIRILGKENNFSKKENLSSKIMEFAIKENIKFASFSGVLINKSDDGDLDYVAESIIGNIEWKEEKPSVIFSGMFSRSEWLSDEQKKADVYYVDEFLNDDIFNMRIRRENVSVVSVSIWLNAYNRKIERHKIKGY